MRTRSKGVLASLAVALAGCAGEPIVTPGPPPPPQGVAPEAGATPPPEAMAGVGSTPPAFVRTEDSDAWVQQTFFVQGQYRRVLLVTSADPAPTSIDVAPFDPNARPDAPTTPRAVRVDRAFTSLQAAADEADGGDLVAVAPGKYAGFVVRAKQACGDRRYLHFKALGKPGDVVVERPNREDPNWMILLDGAHHVIVEGFALAGSAGGARAGIMIDGGFARTSRMAHHIVIASVFSHHHRSWGLHATDSHTVLMQNSVFGWSREEHCAYIADGSDNWVIRRNVFMSSRASGLQVNLDPVASFAELRNHPALATYPPLPANREWALGLVKRAADKFGEHNFPDGRGENFIIEENVMFDNGEGGAAALNLAGLSDSLIQNNLMYANKSSGIAQWDDGNPYDAPFVTPGPKKPADVTGPEALPAWGCHGNLIRNNTVLMSRAGRPAMQSGNGSWGTRVFNNLLVNDQPPSIEVMNTSIWRFEAAANVLNTVGYEDVDASLRSLATALPETRATTGITRARVAGELVRYGEDPWVVIEGSWWRPNPARPDFRPRAGSALLVGRGEPKQLPAVDLSGKKRRGADIGALAP